MFRKYNFQEVPTASSTSCNNIYILDSAKSAARFATNVVRLFLQLASLLGEFMQGRSLLFQTNLLLFPVFHSSVLTQVFSVPARRGRNWFVWSHFCICLKLALLFVIGSKRRDLKPPHCPNNLVTVCSISPELLGGQIEMSDICVWFCYLSDKPKTSGFIGSK